MIYTRKPLQNIVGFLRAINLENKFLSWPYGALCRVESAANPQESNPIFSRTHFLSDVLCVRA